MKIEGDSVPISVIIPVYNVFQWLDQCMESVVEQTFTDFEIILINDGSTDGSDSKCEEWKAKDSRIRYISQENRGPSLTRNLGIMEARGQYLVFVDADDWLNLEYLEKLYRCIQETGAEISECDIWRYNDMTGKKLYRACYGNMGIGYTLEQHMKYGNTAIWKCMIKRTLFTNYQIEFPDCHSQPRAVYALLLALGNKIENVREPLYYYRLLRKGSLSEKPREESGGSVIGVQAFEYLLTGFKNRGLYLQYKKLLEGILNYKLSDILAAYFCRREKNDFNKMVVGYQAFIKKYFPDCRDDTYITFGGYNLNRIMWRVNLLHNPYCRFNFSSIISLMSTIQTQPLCTHKNKYREIMVNRDISSGFWDILEEIRPQFIVIDLIEERFDILEYQGSYITKSDAFDGAGIDLGKTRIINRDSEACRVLWEDSCIRFIKKLQEYVSSNNIIVLRNYLSEKVGDINNQELYGSVGKIQRMNHILEHYYDFFLANCQGAKVIETSKSKFYFTDRQYEYGALPSHLNDIVNEEIALKVEGVIGL